MRLYFAAILTAALTGATCAPASAKDGQPRAASPELYRQLVDCRQVAEAAARLACYDRQVAALDAATQSREIVIADKAEVRAARRGLFGFAVPVGRLLGLGSDDASPVEDAAETVDRIDTSVASVGRGGSGWKLRFAEGGTWEQADVKNFVMSPRIGQSAAIKKGVLGSYFVSVNGQPGIRFRRVE